MTDKTNVTDEALLPCPFCGESTGLDFNDGSTYRWGIASCSSCGASAGETRREYPDKGEWHKQAIEEWNTRESQHYEREIADFETYEKDIENELLLCKVKISELSAQVNYLRNYTLDILASDNDFARIDAIANEMLVATAEQSLQKHDDELYDRCIKIIEEWEHKPIMNQLLVIINNIIGLKSK